MSSPCISPFLFIVDTTEYAGNFERTLCAYMTGMVGDCGVGGEYASLFQTETGKESHELFPLIAMEEDGCRRPCSIFQNAKGRYNSVVIFFDTKPNKGQIKILKKRADTFSKMKHKWVSPFKILSFRLLEVTITRKELPI